MHPSHDKLTGLLLGTLIEDEADQVADHIDQCPVCEETVRDLETMSDEMILSMRRPMVQNPLEQESHCGRLLEIVEAIGIDCSNAANDAAPVDHELGAIRDYLLLSKLGKGGMGTVYKALHQKLEKIVALKVLPAERMEDVRAVDRFEREMKAVGRLSHANIVGAHDAGEHEGTHFLVMEYVDGVDLSELVRRAGPLPIADACELVRQAAIGLQHAHQHGLVHRDIKPSNLMITRQGQLKILDLGLARLHNGHQGELTSTGQMMGTIDYMAPEQTGDSHDVDIRADIYGLGATLFKLLCERAPYADQQYDTLIKKLNALATQPVPSIRERREEVPADLADIVTKMLAKDADQRYATPEEVAVALQPFAKGCDLAALLEQLIDTPGARELEQSAIGTQDSLKSGSVDTAPTIDLSPTSSLPLGEGPHCTPHAPREETSPDVVVGSTDQTAPPTESLQESHEAQESGSSATKQPARHPDHAKTSSGPWYTNPRNRVIIAAAALGGILLLGVITLFFQTKDGTIVVEIDDPEGLIQVTVDGQDIVITDTNAGEPIRLKSGDHKLHVTRAGLEFTTDKFTLKRTDKVVLSVKLIDGEVRVVQKDDTDTVLGSRPIDKAPVQTVAAPSLWQPGPDENVLPGLVPRPAKFDGIKRWQMETTAPRTQVRCVDWTNDGKFIAAGSNTGMIRIFDATTLECRQVLPGTLCNSVAWSGDGKHLLVTGAFEVDGTPCDAAIWGRDGTFLPIRKEGVVDGASSADWSPDNSHFVIATFRHGFAPRDDVATPGEIVGVASIWSRDGEFIRTIDSDPTSSVSWSPDGKFIAAGARRSGRVLIWSVDGEPVANVLAYKQSPETRVTWSPDSQWLATIGYDPEPKVKLWRRDGTAGPEYLPDDSHRHNLYEPAWSPDGQRLAIAGVGGIHILNTKGVFQKFLRGDLGNNRAIAWSPDGSRIVTGGDLGLTVLDVAGEQRNELVSGIQRAMLAWSPDSELLAISAAENSATNVHLLRRDGWFDKAIDRHFTAGRPEWSSDGERIVLGWLHTNTSVILNSDPQDSEMEQLAQMTPAAFTVWNPLGTELASVNYRDSEAVIRIWDREGQALTTVQIPSKASHLAWHPDVELLAINAHPGILFIRRDGQVEKTVADQGASAGLAWSPDGEWLAAAAASDHLTRLIRRDGTLGPALSQNGLAIAWSPDSRQVAVSKVERTVEVWNLEGKLLRSLTGHDGNVGSVSWSSDGKYLTSGSGSIVINWNATTWEPEWTHVLLGNDQTATFTAAGQVINGTPGLIEERFVYLVENDDGRLQTLKPSEFEVRIGQSLTVQPFDTPAQHRELAEFVLAHDGQVELRSLGDDGLRYAGWWPEAKKLPDEDFAVHVVAGEFITVENSKAFGGLLRKARVWFVDLGSKSDGDEILKNLKDLSALKHIRCNLHGVTDTGLVHLRALRANVLTLSDQPFSDKGIHHISSIASVKELRLERTAITDVSLQYLAALQLERLTLQGTKVTQAGVTALSKALPNCRIEWDGGVIEPTTDPNRSVAEWVLQNSGTVTISHRFSRDANAGVESVEDLPQTAFDVVSIYPMKAEQMSEEVVKLLPALTQLQDINFVATQIGDDTLDQLNGLPNLRGINLQLTRVTDGGIGQLAASTPTIKSLHLGNTVVTNTGIEHLQALPQLKELFLGGTSADDSSLKLLSNHSGLHRLELRSTNVSDDGLANLYRLKALTQLDLLGTKVTEAGVTALSKALPNCRIQWDGGVIEPTSDLNRRAAAWVLGHGGYVDTVGHGRISRSQEMPDEAFEIRAVYLDYTDGEVTDDELQHLVGLKSLSIVGLTGHKQITDAGVSILASIQGLTQLGLGSTGVTDVGAEELRSLTKLQSLDLHSTGITDAAVTHLAGLPELTKLELYITNVGDAAMPTLGKLSRLESLYLHGTKITDAGIAQLVKLPLKSVSLNNTATGDAALEQLSQIKTLEVLDVGSPALTDAGFAHLANLPALKSLNIKAGGDQLTDEGMTHIAKLKRLKFLQLGAPKMTEQGLKTIATMQGLERLDLQKRNITDEWLSQLHGMKNLRALYLYKDPEDTGEGLVRLLQALPECAVQSYDADTQQKIALAKAKLKKDSQYE